MWKGRSGTTSFALLSLITAAVATNAREQASYDGAEIAAKVGEEEKAQNLSPKKLEREINDFNKYVQLCIVRERQTSTLHAVKPLLLWANVMVFQLAISSVFHLWHNFESLE